MRVLIIGAGGLGCPAALKLREHTLTVVDPDRVELSNLHRQILYTRADVGRPKVERVAEQLGARGLQLRVTAENAPALFREADVVIDGTDGVATKLMLNDIAVQTQVPLIYGGVLKLHGQAMAIVPGGPCLRCLFQDPVEGPTCAQVGVLGTVAGVLGVKQAELALERRPGVLHLFDGRTLRWRELRVQRSADCPVCPATVDITREVCPMTYVRVKLMLERLEPGRLLEVWLTGEEPLKNVPRAAEEEGHQVLALERSAERSRLLLKVG